MAEFLVADVFVIRNRNWFVLAGDILSGEISGGMRVSVPTYGNLEIRSIEFARKSNLREYVCLCIEREDAQEMQTKIEPELLGKMVYIA